MESSDSELTVVPLALARKPAEQPEITTQELERVAEKVRRTGNYWHIFKAAIERSGLTEEEVRDVLEIQSPQWSLFQRKAQEKGAKHFSHQRLSEFCDLVGNDLLILVLAYLRGYECRPLKSELQRENEDLKRQLAESKAREAYAIEVIAKVNGK